MPLSNLQVQNLKAPCRTRKLSDGEGLYLHLTSSGSKLWRMAYRYGGKQKTLAFGAYPAVSLADARKLKAAARQTLAAGKDPALEAKRARQNAELEAASSFNAIADEFLLKAEKEGRAEATMAKKRWLLDMAREQFGDMPVREIQAADVLAALRIVEQQGNYETARRLRSTIGQVLRYAVATARSDADPTAALRGALITPKVSHRAAIVDKGEFGKLIRSVWRYSGSPETSLGLRLMALLYPRPGELRFSNWQEFDLDNGYWTIPAARTKMRREHRKPLSGFAIELLRDFLPVRRTDGLLLPSLSSVSVPISENTLNLALRRLGYGKDEACSHGFRASASSILNESGLWSADAIEAELAHASGSEVRRAYHRASYWDERTRMAEWWSTQIKDAASGYTLKSIENLPAEIPFDLSDKSR
jgi:integrase